MGVVHLSLLAPLAPRVGRRVTPDLFQGGFVGSAKWFVGRADDGGAHTAIPPVPASATRRFMAFGRLSFNPGQGSFLVAEGVRTRRPAERWTVVGRCVSAAAPVFPSFPAARGRPETSK